MKRTSRVRKPNNSRQRYTFQENIDILLLTERIEHKTIKEQLKLIQEEKSIILKKINSIKMEKRKGKHFKFP